MELMSLLDWVSMQDSLNLAKQLVMKSRQRAARRGLLVALNRQFEFEKLDDTSVESVTTLVGASSWLTPTKRDLGFELMVRQSVESVLRSA